VPLIYFHGDSGGGHYVKRLAKLLGSNQPIFVVAPHGLDHEAVPRSLEAMAADRLPLIVDAQPQGPYRLGGYCIGGLVAFEVARMLVAAGKKVEMVAMIDPPTVNARQSVQTLFSILDRVRPVGGPVVERAIAWTWYCMARIESVSNLSHSGQWAWAKAKVRALAVAGKSQALHALRGVTHQATKPSPVRYGIAMSRYFPAPLAVRVIYFSAEYDGEVWRRLCSDLEVIKLPRDHFGMFTDPTDLVDHLRARL
jgi:thioesterase domain-containing protein